MADLNAWVQAQQKRGYTKEQINAYLARKGYARGYAAPSPPSAMAQSSKASFKASKPHYKLIILAVIAIAGVASLFLADKLQPTSPQSTSLQPINTTTHENGDVMETYAGTISSISKGASVTLTKGDKSKQFSISEKHPFAFISFGPDTRIMSRVIRVNPKVGDEVSSLSLVIPRGEEPYVSRVVIKYSEQKVD